MQIAIPPASNEPRINDRIRAREVLLVDSDGTKLGVKPFTEALQLAKDQDLDLVEVAANANPPVCRIMDYGKFRFDATQRAKESKRKTTQAQIKEMKYRVKIGPGDFDTKTRKVLEFLHEGHKVKITIMFRGRETAHPHLGKNILDRIADQASSFAKVEAAPKLDGRNMIMVLAPDRRAQQQQQARAAKEPGDAPAPANGATAGPGVEAAPAVAAAAPAASQAPQQAEQHEQEQEHQQQPEQQET
jgi:translation initiation factor IF-3